MFSISDTLSHHRATRDQYMLAARNARSEHAYGYQRGVPPLAQHYVTKEWMRVPRMVPTLPALRCFLRHARAANRKLVQVKRLQRMLSQPNNWDGWI